jgi:purine-nucleoside phosphorylase
MNPIARVTGRSDWRAAVMLGSGLSELGRALVGGSPVPYSQIEGMPDSTVIGHQGVLYWGDVGSTPTLVFAGRAHLYEGHDANTVTYWVRASAAAGCDTFVITNAAGAINAALEVGAPCLISDHINLTGHNPLIGPNDDSLGPRFPDQSALYDPGLRALAQEIDPALSEGVYAGLLGPTYETPAEVRMLRTLGADLVGMSTVLESIAAGYLGARVLGISIVTNAAAGISPKPLSHEEVAVAGRSAAARLEALLRGVLAKL